MKDKIKEYLQEKGRVTVNDLAQALGKDGSKDFRELIKNPVSDGKKAPDSFWRWW